MTKTARVSLGGVPSTTASLSLPSTGKRSLKDKETAESFKLYPFGGEDYAWDEWSVKFLAIALLKGVKDYLLPDPDDFYKVPLNTQWKKHKDPLDQTKLSDELVAAWEANIKSVHLLTLGTNGVPFNMVKGAKTTKLLRGDARLGWKLLSDKYAPTEL